MALTLESREVVDAVRIWERADKDTRKRIRRATKPVVARVRSDLMGNAKSGQDRKIVSTARIRTGKNPAIVVGSAKRFDGGARTSELARVYEFGGHRDYRVRYRGKRGSTSFPVLRHTQRMIPWRVKEGRMVYPAVAENAPQLVRGWLRAVVEGYYEHG